MMRRISKRRHNGQSTWKQMAIDGKTNMIAQCAKIIDESGSILITKEGNRTAMPEIIYDLFWQGIYGNLKTANIVTACTQLSELDDEVPSLIMDVINLFDAEMVIMDRKPRERFLRLTNIMVALDQEWCSKMCRSSLELESLSEFGVITKAFSTKSVKIKTKLYYKQNKFNLFREEIEGYSKIIVELNRYTNQKVQKPEEIVLNLKAIIGSFSLDPTRVIDCILEVCQTKVSDYTFLIGLIRTFVPDLEHLCEVIGFRYVRYANQTTPKSFHRLVCVLLHFEVIKFEDLLPWLTPDDKGIAKAIENALELNKPYRKDKNYNESDKNQKLGLCEEALAMGSWKVFKDLITFFPQGYLLEKPIIALSVSRLVHHLVDSLLIDLLHMKPSSKRKIIPFKFEVTPLTPPQPKTCEELSEYVFPILITLGSSAHFDVKLLMKLARLLAKVMEKVNADNSGKLDFLRGHIADVIVSSLLPSISNLEANCCVSEAYWALIKMYPLQMRYSMYYMWREYVLKQQAVLSKKCQGKVNMKSCMKRVSKENVKQIGRLLGKISHYSPATLFDYILFQIQMYDNLIGPVVDSLKYMTSLSFDVMGFCIYDSLQNDPKKRVKHDGCAISPWFQSTSLFCATAFKKYNVDLSGILLYITDQLSQNSSAELILLKEIMQKMGGILITNDMTPHQIQALGGGELIKAEAGYFFQQKNFKKTAARLKEALIENNLTGPLGMILAQHKNHIMFVQSKKYDLRFVGQLYDECHDTLLQFVTFITSNINESDNLMPPLVDLMCVHNLEPSSAFCLYRPILHFHVHRKYTYNFRGSSTKVKFNTGDIMFNWIKDISHVFERLWPNREWDDMSSEFVALFWSLDLSDLKVPTDAYEKEIVKYKELEQTQGKQSKSDMEKANTMHEKLSQELKEQEHHVASIFEKLKEEKDKWLLPGPVKPSKNEMITQFLRICIFPRCIYSVLDALYCAEFIHTLHKIQTKCFSTLLFYDRLFCDITFAVMSCTEDEANRFGTFLCSVLENIMKWHKSKETFDKECSNTPGFQTKFRSGNELSEDNDNVHFENFRHVCHKWHYKITKSLLSLLDSKDYIQIRNSITVLIKMLPVYPVIDKLCLFIDRRIDKIKEVEKNNRKDLYTLATSYSGQLVLRIESWCTEQDFHLVSDPNYAINIDENQTETDSPESSPASSPKEQNSPRTSPEASPISSPSSVEEEETSPPAKKKPKQDSEPSAKNDRKSSSPPLQIEMDEYYIDKKLEYHRSRGHDDFFQYEDNNLDDDDLVDCSGYSSGKKDRKYSSNSNSSGHRKKSESPRDDKRSNSNNSTKYSSTSPRSVSSKDDSIKLKKSKNRKARSSEPKKDRKVTKRRERVRSEEIDFD